MNNVSLDNEKTWTDESGHTFNECIRQEYMGNHCIFSGGIVTNSDPKEDTLYISLEKDGVEPITVMMRPDEVAAINWICAGLLFTWGHGIRDAIKGHSEKCRGWIGNDDEWESVIASFRGSPDAEHAPDGELASR